MTSRVQHQQPAGISSAEKMTFGIPARQSVRKNLFLATMAAGLTLATVSPAQEVSTDPVGFVKVTVPANSDAVLAVPLYRPPEFKGTIQSLSANQFTASGQPSWQTNQFSYSADTQNKTYAIIITTGQKEGLTAKIISNTSNSFTVELEAGDSLDGIASANGSQLGDSFDIVPFWTPKSLFPTPPVIGTQMFLTTETPGINHSATNLFVYTGVKWIQSPTTVDDFALRFGQSFIVRNNSASQQSLSMVGNVPMKTHRRILKTYASTNRQDSWIAFSSPVPQAIGESGLGFTPGDQLYVFDNAATGKNKAASEIIVFTGSFWSVAGTNVNSTFYLQPGQGYIYRNNNNQLAERVIPWVGLPDYLE